MKRTINQTAGFDFAGDTAGNNEIHQDYVNFKPDFDGSKEEPCSKRVFVSSRNSENECKKNLNIKIQH